MEVATAKLISMLALGLGSFLCGMLPAYFSNRARERHPLLISCLLCFGGGVLLATSVVHMLPEAKEKLPKDAELMFCLGFFLVYLVDEIVHLFHGGQSSHREAHTAYGSGERTCLLREEVREQERAGVPQERCGDAESSRMCHVGHTEPSNRSSGIIGLLCALCVHSVLEGLTIGLQDTTSQVFLLLGAVSCHKFVVAFCVGAELCDTLQGRLCALIVCITLFSAGSVVGIAAGAGLDSVNVLQDSPAVSIMQALAAGTLLYVTVSEVLPRERASCWQGRKRTAGFTQFTAVAVGFTLMYLSTKYLDFDGA